MNTLTVRVSGYDAQIKREVGCRRTIRIPDGHDIVFAVSNAAAALVQKLEEKRVRILEKNKFEDRHRQRMFQ